MTSLFTNSEQILSYGKSGDDELLGDSAGGGDGATAEAGEVIAIGAGDFLDEAEVAQASEITGDAGDGHLREKRFQIGTANTTDVELRTLQGAQQGMLGLVEKLKPLTRWPSTSLGVRRAKAALFQWVQIPPGEMLQPEATGATMEVTKWLKPSDSGPQNSVAARVCRP